MTLQRTLGKFVRTPRTGDVGERCELCGASLGRDHGHVADVEKRTLACACRPCALLFTREGAGSTKWRTVPDRHRHDPSFALSAGQWATLGIPVSMAFFFKSTTIHRWVAVYPSPAGPVESLLALDAWESIARESSLVSDLAPDLEAILVVAGREDYECMLVPIHACYALIGSVRKTWRGVDGGDEARAAIAERIRTLRARCEGESEAT